MTVCAAALVALTGCASSGTTEPSAAPSADPRNKQRESQAELASCMKASGFTYHPVVSAPDLPEEVKQQLSGDYEAMKKHRSKYGFGFAASIVYPNDPGGGRLVLRADSDASDGDPNAKVVAGLSQTEREAYRKAMDGCMLDMINKATGRKLTSMEDAAKAQQDMIKQAIAREIDGDPRLVELAGPFADCLKGKGYRVTSQRPSEIARSTEQPFLQELVKLGANRTPDQARPVLAREIKAALDDLECGKEFYAAYRPKSNAVYEQVSPVPGMGMSVAVAR